MVSEIPSPGVTFIESPAQVELVRAMRRLNDALDHNWGPFDPEAIGLIVLRMARVYCRMTVPPLNLVETEFPRGIDDGIYARWSDDKGTHRE